MARKIRKVRGYRVRPARVFPNVLFGDLGRRGGIVGIAHARGKMVTATLGRREAIRLAMAICQLIGGHDVVKL